MARQATLRGDSSRPRYRFVASVSVLEPSAPAPPKSNEKAACNRPLPLTRMVGRAEIVAALAVQLAQRRFITIVGAGGIWQDDGGGCNSRCRDAELP